MQHKMANILLGLALLAAVLTVPVCSENNNEESNKNNAYRLPKSVVPTDYSIHYKDLNFDTSTFKGVVTIHATVKEEIKSIVLHSGNLEISKKDVDVSYVKDPSPLTIDNVDHNVTTEKFTISMKENLKSNKDIEISINFSGKFRDDMIGFYKSSYFEKVDQEKWLLSTQFESTHARHAFPCFDEPAFKAKFKLIFDMSKSTKDYGCLTNMPTKLTENQCISESTEKMSTYLVAFIISTFTSSSREGSLVNVWSRPEAKSQTIYALDIGNKILEHFNKLFDEKYPLPKLDMVAVPDFSAGAMENWGLITYRETAVLYDDKDSSDAAQQRVASVIVHEIAHTWFGNLVTPEWWSYLWLSEAFARYFQYMSTHKIEPSWKMDQQFVVEQHQAALGVDSLEDSEAMTRLAITQAEIARMGDSITYAKGASIVRMMEKTFGSDLFYAALRNYIQSKKWNSATPDDLWKAFQNEVDKDPQIEVNVTAVLQTWTEQPGFPCIDVTIKKNTIELTQSRFLLRKINEIPKESPWSVPITWTSSSQGSSKTKPVHWLSKRQDSFPNDYKNDDWLILNVESTGFYRVNYDKDSWNRIFKVLTTGDFSKIHELNRAAIVDDLLNLARAELLPYETALRGIQYLKRENNYLPFKSAFTALDYLIRKFSGSADEKIFNEHVLSLFENIYKKLSYNDKNSDDRLTILLRQELNNKACTLGHSDCITQSKIYFSNWRTKKESIPKNQRATAYCTAIKYGNEEDWEFLMTEYKKANVAAEQVVILSALGCSTNTTILEKYLLNALGGFQKSRIRKQDVSSVFSGVYSASPENAAYMLDFVEKHHDEISKYHNNPNEIANLISGALQKYPSKKLISKLEDILKSNVTNIKSINSSLEKTMALAKFEVEWFKKHGPTIINWIKTAKDTAYRLPTNVIPTAYTIHLTPFIKPNNFTFNGIVKIIADVKEATNQIVLHTDLIDIQKLTIKNLKEKDTHVLEWEEVIREKKYHFSKIMMKETIEAGTEISIEISYEGILNTEMRGFYRSSYKIDGQTRWLAATHLEPVGARRLFPCFDEPALKATFDISVDVPENYHAVSNMPLKKQEKGLWEFETTPPMSSYLVAVVVSDFKSISQTDDSANRTYGVWANPLVQHQLNYSLSVMKPVVDFFEKKLGHKYTLPKLDMVALPDFTSGAMENWGLLTFRETNMLYDPEKMSTVANKHSVRNVIAHEITHQWFGNLVSPLWWDYVWLSEGFARYFQYYAHGEDEKTWNLEAQLVVDHLQTSFAKDASTGTHPVTATVYSPTEIRAIFDSISYAKAASLIRMLQKLTGEKVFYAALHSYLDKCKLSTGTPELLFAAFQTEVSKDNTIKIESVSDFMKSWTEQSGFPVIDVSIAGKGIKLTQKRFFSRPMNNEKDKTKWIVPINWATQSESDFKNTSAKAYLTTESIQLNDVDIEGWVIFNVQQMGYYRVNYDKTLWGRIISALNSNEFNKIHELNRASLMDDLLNLGRANYVDYDLVLEGVRYLSREDKYAPWKAALTGLSYLSKRFAGRTEIHGAYRAYLLKLLQPTHDRLGFEDQKNDKDTDILLRKLVNTWLCTYEHEGCVKEASKLFQKEKTDAKFPITPNQRDYVYCSAIKHGNSADWDYLYKRFEASNYATERLAIVTALSCSQNAANLEKLLSVAITPDSEIRLQDASKVFTSVVGGGLLGVETTLSFIEKNYKKIVEYLGEDAVKSTLSTISKRLSTTTLYGKFEKFVNDAEKNTPNIAKSLQASLKRAKVELDWYNEKAPKIFKWLDVNDPQTDYRLPTSAMPTAYDIYLEPEFEKFTFVGKVSIDIKIITDTMNIILHQKDLEIKTIPSSDPSHMITLKENSTTQMLTLYFGKTLTAKSTIKLTFDYTGHLRDDMRGFYRSYYLDKEGNKRWIASTQFEPVYARRAFPCFDEPSFKAKFTINIAKPKGYRTLSNMGSSPKETNDTATGKSWDKYEPSLEMSPYLVAFVVSDFEKTVGKDSKVGVWSRPQIADKLTYASVVGEKAIKFLENLTKIDYPLKEMNFVAVPDFDMGAMENWGLVTYREYGLTYDVHQISASYKRYVNTVISHELVHMWFGDLVTCEWWDYTWLNEGFAEYVSYIVSNASEPDWKLLKQFVVNELQVALQADASVSSHPMNNKVNTPTEAQDGFDKIAYQKSASVLRMLHHSFGQRLFEDALHDYLNGHKYSTARPEYLVAAIQAQLDKVSGGKVPGELEVNVETAMNSWTTQAGYPVVTAARVNDDSVQLSQKRFLTSASNSSESKHVYWTPITYTTESEQDFANTSPKLWLGDKNKTITVPANKWYLLNVQQIGYYRVNYDVANWKQLIKLLNSDAFEEIDEANRAQIIDDAFSLAQAGQLEYDLAFNASSYLVRETEYLPWKALFSSLSYLTQRIDGKSKAREVFANYVLTLLDGAYEKLGFKEDMEKDPHTDQLARELILSWACKYGHEDCIKQSKEYFKKESVTPNIAGTVYCTAIEHGTSDDWMTLLKKYHNSELAAEYITILKSLGCSKNATLLEMYLNLAIEENSAIRRQDVQTALSSVYTSSQVGLRTALTYFEKNLDKLNEYFNDWKLVGGLFTSLAGRVSTQEDIEIIEKLANNQVATNIKSSLESAVKTAKKNLEWYEGRSEKIEVWLEKYKDQTQESSTTSTEESSSSSVTVTESSSTANPGNETSTSKPGTASIPVMLSLTSMLLLSFSTYLLY